MEAIFKALTVNEDIPAATANLGPKAANQPSPAGLA